MCELMIIARGVLLGILRGVLLHVLPSSLNPDPISDQKCHFSHSFSDLVSKFMSTSLRLEQQGKRFLEIHFEFAYFSFFLTYLFGTATINTFIRPRSSLENYTRLQTKMGEVYTLFLTCALRAGSLVRIRGKLF